MTYTKGYMKSNKEQIDFSQLSAEDILDMYPEMDESEIMNHVHPEYGKPKGYRDYRILRGQLDSYAIKFDRSDGTTITIPYECSMLNGKKELVLKEQNELSPIYNSDFISMYPEMPIIVCVDGKEADLAGPLFPDCIATTSIGSPYKSDWEILKGKLVLLWPTQDKAGISFVIEVLSILKGQIK